MGKNKDFEGKVELDDDLLDQVSGGDSLWASATGITCPFCGYDGQHKAELEYERTENMTTIGPTKAIYCGSCNGIIWSRDSL